MPLNTSSNLTRRLLTIVAICSFLSACVSDQTYLPVEPGDVTASTPETPAGEQGATTQPLLIEEIIVDASNPDGSWSRQQRLDNSQLVGGSHPAQIALLLPLTSPLGHAAEAFQRGFMDAHNRSYSRTSIHIYDTGSEHDLAALYYLSAINDGHQFVVGPLGKQAVDSLLIQQELLSPTLLIGQVPTDRVIANAWGISLSPEDEARAVARKALSSGLSHAAVLHRNNQWGSRISLAFRDAFEAEGGIVVSENRFQPGAGDSGSAIKHLLALNESEARHQALSNLLGHKLKFDSRRRTDMDFVFFAGNSKEARRVVPQLKFYRAHDLPVYGTSSVFSGKSDPVSDADLAGLIFPDIPWMLTGLDSESYSAPKPSQASAQPATDPSAPTPLSAPLSAEGRTMLGLDPATMPQAATPGQTTPVPGSAPSLRSQSRELPYGGSPLDRLYALGQTAFDVIPHIASLTADPSINYPGKSMTVQVDDAGNLIRQFAWAQFTTKGIRVELPAGNAIVQ